MSAASDEEVCELLPWDTEFFGIRIARVKAARIIDDVASRVDEWCRAREVKCVYYLPAAADALMGAEVLQRAGYRLVDVKMTLEHDRSTRAAVLRKDDVTIRPATAADSMAMEEIAETSHRGGRFERDRKFTLERAIEMYRVWIRNGLKNEHVIVADVAGKVAGYSVCKMTGNDGVISLLAVDAAVRGEGIGGLLVNASLDYFAIDGKTRVRVVTQAWNVPAQRLYQRCGFVTSACTFGYHKWFN